VIRDCDGRLRVEPGEDDPRGAKRQVDRESLVAFVLANICSVDPDDVADPLKLRQLLFRWRKESH
jgi:hypothetical protein